MMRAVPQVAQCAHVDGQQVVEVVGDPADHLADRFEFPGLTQRLLAWRWSLTSSTVVT